MSKINGQLSVNLETYYRERYGNEHGYQAYSERGKPCNVPLHSEYQPGDLVIVTSNENGDGKSVKRMGVVLGWIDSSDGTLKTDSDGNVSMDDIRHATTADTKYFEKDDNFKAHLLSKRYNIMYNIGKAKYVINTHNGLDKHKDGGNFYGIEIYSNKRKFIKAINHLKRKGYTAEN